MIAFSLLVVFSLQALQIQGEDWTRSEDAKASVIAIQKPTVLVFFSSTCPCSKAHEPVIEEMSQEFPSISFFGVVSGVHEKRQDFLSKTKWKGPLIRDEGGRLARSFAVRKTPHAIFLDKEGNVLYTGGIDDSSDPKKSKRPFLREAITRCLEGKPIVQKNQRVFGCYLKL